MHRPDNHRYLGLSSLAVLLGASLLKTTTTRQTKQSLLKKKGYKKRYNIVLVRNYLQWNLDLTVTLVSNTPELNRTDCIGKDDRTQRKSGREIYYALPEVEFWWRTR